MCGEGVGVRVLTWGADKRSSEVGVLKKGEYGISENTLAVKRRVLFLAICLLLWKMKRRVR